MREAIILAGGFGTRLRESVPDLPKVLAPVAGRPFISYVIDHLRRQGVQDFVFSLGYKADVIVQFLENEYPTLQYKTVIEDEPLGTGGGIQLAVKAATKDHVLIANGDTLFDVDLDELYRVHLHNNAACTLALKPLTNFERYGVVTVGPGSEITSFQEKKFYPQGLINGGIYLLHKQEVLQRALPDKFSFESGYLEQFVAERKFYGSIQDKYFIDIGVPADFRQANEDFRRTELNLTEVNRSWTLFLDRDGVINEEKLGQYVLNWSEFIFSEGVLENFKILSKLFGRIFLVTNQRGVTKGLMTEEDLSDIHREMQAEIAKAGGHLDKIYYCTNKDNRCFHRKPNPGMAFDAKKDFPETEFSRAIMVGNKPSDMRFGRSAGMFTVFITSTNPNQPFPHPDIDLVFASLADFALALQP